MGWRRKLLVAAGSAVAQYFFDPDLGATRRAAAQARLTGLVRRPAKRIADQATRTSADEWPENDPVLADKIRSEVLGGSERDSGATPANVEDAPSASQAARRRTS